MASLDGMSEDGDCVEIKCGKASHELAKEGKIPDYYIPQLQHQMFLSNAKKIYYFSYYSDFDFELLMCYRDDEYIEKMISEEEKFWDCVTKAIEPELTSKDYKKKEDFGWLMLCNEWKSVQKAKQEILEREEQIRKQLIQSSDGQNCCGAGVKVKKIIKKGSIDYSKIYELQNVDLEKYRKEGCEYWKISIGEDDEL